MRNYHHVFLMIVMMFCLNFGSPNKDCRESMERKRRTYDDAPPRGMHQNINGLNKRNIWSNVAFSSRSKHAQTSKEERKRSNDVPPAKAHNVPNSIDRRSYDKHPLGIQHIPNSKEDRQRRSFVIPSPGLQHLLNGQEKRNIRSYIGPPKGIQHVPNYPKKRHMRSNDKPPVGLRYVSNFPNERNIRSYDISPPGRQHMLTGLQERTRRSYGEPSLKQHVANGQEERKIMSNKEVIRRASPDMKYVSKIKGDRKRRSYSRPSSGKLHMLNSLGKRSYVRRSWRSYDMHHPHRIQHVLNIKTIRKMGSNDKHPNGRNRLQKRKRRSYRRPPLGIQQMLDHKGERNRRSYDKHSFGFHHWSTTKEERKRRSYDKHGKLDSSLGRRNHRLYDRPFYGIKSVQIVQGKRKIRSYDLPPNGIEHISIGHRERKRSYSASPFEKKQVSNSRIKRKMMPYHNSAIGVQHVESSFRLGERRKRSHYGPPNGKYPLQHGQDNRKRRSYNLPPSGTQHVSNGREHT